MSWLFIDSATPNEIRVGTLSTEKISIRTLRARVRALLVEVRRRYSVADLRRMKGICVVHGPGSFSAVRGGVLAANLLARLLRIPLIGVTKSESLDLKQLLSELEAGKREASSYVMPTYDAEPNITMSCHP